MLTYVANQNVEMFAKINCAARMLLAKLSIMSVDVCADLVTTEIPWTVVSDVDRCRCLVDFHQIVHLTHTVTIKFANQPVTTIWNVAKTRSAITVSVSTLAINRKLAE